MSKERFLAQYGSAKHIDKLIDHPDWKIRYFVARNLNLKSHHIDKLVDDVNYDTREAAVQHPLAKSRHKKAFKSLYDEKTPEDFHRFISDPNTYVISAVASSHKLNSDHIDKLIDHPDVEIRGLTARYARLEPHHIDKIMEDESDHVKVSLLSNPTPNLKKGHAAKMINDSNAYVSGHAKRAHDQWVD